MGHFLVDGNLIKKASFLLFFVVSLLFLSFFFRLFAVFAARARFNWKEFSSKIPIRVTSRYWINQFWFECKTSTLIMDFLWRDVWRKTRARAASPLVLSPDGYSGHYSLSRHSIPVDANNILYFKHNKRSLLETWKTEIRVGFYTSSLIPSAYVQKYCDDVIKHFMPDCALFLCKFCSL